jgi:ribosomal protein S18 acetylase RimI-like enzyme
MSTNRIETEHGFLVYRLAPGRTAEIVDIAVANTARRTGVGRSLFQAMLAKLPPEHEVIYAFTRASNHIARRWYRALGFRGTFVPNFYGDDDPDAVLLVRRPQSGVQAPREELGSYS